MQLNRSGDNRAAVMAMWEDADSRHPCVKTENVENTIHFQAGQLLGFLAQITCFEERLSRLKQIQQFSALNHSRDLFLTHYSLKNVS